MFLIYLAKCLDLNAASFDIILTANLQEPNDILGLW